MKYGRRGIQIYCADLVAADDAGGLCIFQFYGKTHASSEIASIGDWGDQRGIGLLIKNISRDNDHWAASSGFVAFSGGEIGQVD